MLDPISDEAFEREEYHNQQLHWRKALEFQRELAQQLAVPCKETNYCGVLPILEELKRGELIKESKIGRDELATLME